MLQINKTTEKFGYNPTILSKGSHSKILLICDYCGKEYDKIYKERVKANNIVDKDSCIDCRFKKREEVSLKLFGCKNSAQRKDIRRKISDTNKNRLRSDEFKKQTKETNLKKYGVSNVMYNSNIQKKQQQTVQNRYGVDNISQVKEIHNIATQNMVKTKRANQTIKLYDNKTRPEIAKELGFSRSHFSKLVIKYGYEEAIKMSPSISSLESMFKAFLEREHINYERQFRVENRIADFKIDKNILIELDGLYWHSDAIIEDNNYHINKRKLYIDNGYSPLFFREYELSENRFRIVQSIVKNKLGQSNQIGGRKCNIVSINKKIAKDFFTKNHLMGNGAGDTIALVHNDIIVSALQIKKRLDGYEISRFCNILNTSIIGGFSKLLNHTSNRPLITFIDLRYGFGTYLKNLGFSYCSTYPSFKWTDGHNIWNRMKFPGSSGYDNGLFRIWDCGQAKYTLIL